MKNPVKSFINNPKAMVAVGVASFIGGAVASAIGAIKAQKEFDNYIQEKQKYLEAVEESTDIVERDERKELLTTVGKIAIDFAPAAGLIVAGILTVTRSYNIQAARIAGLTAAYASLDAAFKKYRERVIADKGEAKDAEYRYGIKQETVECVDEDGKVKKEKVDIIDADDYFIFSYETTDEWAASTDYDKTFIECVQAQLDNNLKSKGHLFLNEALTALGMSDCKKGAVTGWVMGNGDDYVDLRAALHWSVDECGRKVPYYIIDPNIDGVIFDKI